MLYSFKTEFVVVNTAAYNNSGIEKLYAYREYVRS